MTTHSLTRLLGWTTILSLAAVAAGTPGETPGAVAHLDGITSTTTLAGRRPRFTRGGSRGMTRSARLAEGFPFSAGRDEWCGEVAEDPATDFSASAPTAADCRAIVDSLDNTDGFWTLQPGDFGDDGWARIASSGTRSFAARYADDGSASSPMRIGTNDVRFYVGRYAVLGKDGKLGLRGTVQCSNDEKMLFVTWGLIHN